MSTPPPFAVDDLRFGVECEFTDPSLSTVRRDVLSRYRAEALRRRRGWGWGLPWRGLDVGPSPSGTRTRLFPHLDQRVLEIATEPLSLEEFRDAKHLLQTAIWDAARAIGLSPGTDEINRWSMHVNVSWPALAVGGDGDLLLRYVADFNDHPELALGGCGGDIRNAPPLALFGPRPRDALRRIVADVATDPQDAFAIAGRLRDRVFRERFVYGSRIHNDFYHAVNVCHVRRRPTRKRRYSTPSMVRIEIRSSYMAPSVDHLLSTLTIVSGRLAYLAGRSTPIAYEGPLLPDPPGGRRFRTRGMQDGVTADAVAACWIGYLAESGLDPAAHAPYLVNPEVRLAAARILAESSAPRRAGSVGDGGP